MSVFNKVLVGIDLMHSGGRDGTSFSLPVEEAIKNGLWLAEKASASLTFFAAVDLPADKLRAAEKDESVISNAQVRTSLAALRRNVELARQRGLNANSRVVSGLPWIEIIREVQRDGYDMVIVGTRNAGALQRLIFGSTAMHLLHDCPCPVWVTRPETRPLPHNILITTDFSPVSDLTLKLGLALGELSGAKVSLLHAVDYVVDRLYSVGLMYFNADEYHSRCHAEAHEKLAEQMARVTGGQPTAKVEMHVVKGDMRADTAILQFIDDRAIDLLLMGTSARHGISGASTGNTAERLVKHVHCSLVAVKPADFICSIKPGAASSAQKVEQ